VQSGRSFKKILPISREAACGAGAPLPKPAWLRVRASVSGGAEDPLRRILSSFSLSTVCREANCPNRAECYSSGTAAFLILGEVCTRRCAFCDLASGTPKPPAADEPQRLAQAVKALGLKYVVVTSPDRDDLRDGGAGHFAAVIAELRRVVKGIEVEVLVPDFKKKEETALEILSATPPDVFNHNIETVPGLYRIARPGASYEGSLALLKAFANKNPHIPTKSGLMLGLGETDDEVVSVLEDLRAHKVGRVTIGQYLAPSKAHLPVRRYVSPEEFDRWRERALAMGFEKAHAGVFVRSSYHASDDAA
jgi:lipoyl synthase